MPSNMNAMPAGVRRSMELLGLFLAGFIIVSGKIIIMPLLMAFFISTLLLPVFRLLRKLRVPELVAIFLSLLLLTSVVICVIWIFSFQTANLLNDFSQLQETVNKHFDTLSRWINRTFGFSADAQLKFINAQGSRLFNSAGSILGSAAGSVSGTLVFLGLMPVYIYLIILYRGLFVKFILKWFQPAQHENVEDILRRIENMVKRYLGGLLIQILYITILLGLILTVCGIRHALLIAIIFAFLNLIPYLGALVSNILGILITLASSDSLVDVLIVLGAITVVQFLDNNILMPRIVGGQVKINALASIVGIITAGAMVGISGMFLALPVMAVLKIIFDHTDHYKQWGILLGDDRPAKSPVVFKRMKRNRNI